MWINPQHNVIYISLNEAPQNCTEYQSYINRIEKRLRRDLRRAFPNVEVTEDEAVWDVMNDIYESEEERYSEYFGFTDEEVDDLFRRYERQNPESHNVTREGLRVWYDGYYTKSGERMYNPRSVVAALTNNNLGNYCQKFWSMRIIQKDR